MGCYSLPPLKESRPEIRVEVLRGEVNVKACLNLVVCSLRFFLVNCSSNVIFFATSEGSPLSFRLTTNSFYVMVIFLIFRFKGQGEGLGMVTYQFPSLDNRGNSNVEIPQSPK
jgi:hypothetical protein